MQYFLATITRQIPLDNEGNTLFRRGFINDLRTVKAESIDHAWGIVKAFRTDDITDIELNPWVLNPEIAEEIPELWRELSEYCCLVMDPNDGMYSAILPAELHLELIPRNVHTSVVYGFLLVNFGVLLVTKIYHRDEILLNWMIDR